MLGITSFCQSQEKHIICFFRSYLSFVSNSAKMVKNQIARFKAYGSNGKLYIYIAYMPFMTENQYITNKT